MSKLTRDQDQYSGVRVNVNATVATARIRFHVDVNVGDPIWPNPRPVQIPRLRGGDPITVTGYPLAMIHAEKLITAVQRGLTNTRWRDFADLWNLIHKHTVDGTELGRSCTQVATHRRTVTIPLADALDGLARTSQQKWTLWRQRQNIDNLPESLAVVLEQLITFGGPALTGSVNGLQWNPKTMQWQPSTTKYTADA